MTITRQRRQCRWRFPSTERVNLFQKSVIRLYLVCPYKVRKKTRPWSSSFKYPRDTPPAPWVNLRLSGYTSLRKMSNKTLVFSSRFLILFISQNISVAEIHWWFTWVHWWKFPCLYEKITSNAKFPARCAVGQKLSRLQKQLFEASMMISM